jgi:DNA invertase Pin-like site-specific DNA recombinase
MALVAEKERDMISQRTKDGLAGQRDEERNSATLDR